MSDVINPRLRELAITDNIVAAALDAHAHGLGLVEALIEATIALAGWRREWSPEVVRATMLQPPAPIVISDPDAIGNLLRAEKERAIASERERDEMAKRLTQATNDSMEGALNLIREDMERAWKAADELFEYKGQGRATEHYDDLGEALDFLRNYLDGEDEAAFLDDNRRDNERDELHRRIASALTRAEAAERSDAESIAMYRRARDRAEAAEKDAGRLAGALRPFVEGYHAVDKCDCDRCSALPAGIEALSAHDAAHAITAPSSTERGRGQD